MYWILIVLVTGVIRTWSGLQADCSRIPDSTTIHPLGAFSNMRFTEEHAYGYRVDLWWAGPCRFGLFEASEGLSGDTPTVSWSWFVMTQEPGGWVSRPD
jgi:hypothetical protein